MNAIEGTDRRQRGVLSLEPQLWEGARFSNGYWFEERARSLVVQGGAWERWSILHCTFEGGYWIGLELQEVDFSCVEFTHVYFREVDFRKSTFRQAVFDHCVFDGCEFASDPEVASGIRRLDCYEATRAEPEQAVSSGVPQCPAPSEPLAPPADRFSGIER